MSERQGTQILGYNSQLNKKVSLRVGDQIVENSFAVTLATDESVVSTLENIEFELQEQGATLDNIFSESVDQGLTLDDIKTNTQNLVPIIGSQGNLSNSQVTEETNQPSSTIDCQYVKSISIFGQTSVASTITLMQSQDNENFYTTGLDYTSSGSENFYIEKPNSNSRYYVLLYSAVGTYTSSLTGK